MTLDSLLLASGKIDLCGDGLRLWQNHVWPMKYEAFGFHTCPRPIDLLVRRLHLTSIWGQASKYVFLLRDAESEAWSFLNKRWRIIWFPYYPLISVLHVLLCCVPCALSLYYIVGNPTSVMITLFVSGLLISLSTRTNICTSDS